MNRNNNKTSGESFPPRRTVNNGRKRQSTEEAGFQPSPRRTRSGKMFNSDFESVNSMNQCNPELPLTDTETQTTRILNLASQISNVMKSQSQNRSKSRQNANERSIECKLDKPVQQSNLYGLYLSENTDEETEMPYDMDRIQVTVDRMEEEEFPADYESDEETLGNHDNQGNTSVKYCDSEADTVVDSEIQFNTGRRGDESAMKTSQNFEMLQGDPAFTKFIQNMVAREMKAEKDKLSLNRTSALKDPISKNGKKTTTNTTPKRGNGVINKVKSPSDTTLYAPALIKATEITNKADLVVYNLFNDQNIAAQTGGGGGDQISHFIEGIRRENSMDLQGRLEKDEPMPGSSRAGPTSIDPVEEAKRKATDLILDAERYKAVVNTPPGTVLTDNLLNKDNKSQLVPEPPVVVLDDDDFFHVTCHVDAALRGKIEQGGFVELERLLPKQRGFFGMSNEENRMNLVQKEGNMYFVPAPSINHITGVRRWEQAFRIYAAIYSQANPSRAAEIWQYVHVINVAASAYSWDNVAYYDTTFRQLMSQNPNRSWSKIYNNMWNIAMRDPLPRNFGSVHSYPYNQQNRRSSGNGNGGGEGSNGKRKPRYCWAFNRGNGQCRDGAKCKFVHQCSYCEEKDHGKSRCSKKGSNQ